MKKLFLALMIVSFSFVAMPLNASAHDLIPQSAVQYVKDNPDATTEEIQKYVEENSPGFTKKFKDKRDAIDTINARGSTYVLGGSGISKFLKEKLQNPEVSIGFIVSGLFLSIILGALHALTPGHGKTMIAAYLIGSKGRPVDAFILGGVVTFTHTASVLLLGLIALFASQYILPETLFPYLSLISGLLILVIGGQLLYKRIRKPVTGLNGEHSHGGKSHTHGPAPTHDHAESPHDHAPHSHDEKHAHPHPHPHVDAKPHKHSHAPTKASAVGNNASVSKKRSWLSRRDSEVSLKSIIGLGASGGIIPCPDALVVLLIAVAINKIVLGIAIVFAFSVGLASVLIGMGLLIIMARPFMNRLSGKPGKIMKVLPIASAVAVVIIGLVFTVKSFFLTGLIS